MNSDSPSPTFSAEGNRNRGATLREQEVEGDSEKIGQSKPLNVESSFNDQPQEENDDIDQKDAILENELFNPNSNELEIHHSANYVDNDQEKSENDDNQNKQDLSQPDELNKAFDKSQEEPAHKNEITDKLEEERKKELEDAGRRQKLKMFHHQRCHL